MKVEKETRRLMEATGELVKKKGDRYKFKNKSKKARKKIERMCVHWIVRKHEEQPTVVKDPDHPGMWRCKICGAIFPIRPKDTPEEYDRQISGFLQTVNQMQFWSVKLGGNATDTKMFLDLKKAVPRFQKVSHQILERVNKRQAWEENQKNSDAMSQFDAYSTFNYRL